MMGTSRDKIPAVHSLMDTSLSHKVDLTENNEQAAASRVDLQQHQQQLQLLLKLVRASTEESRELRAALQQQAGAAAAEAALMAEFQAQLSTDRELSAAVVKSAWEGRPGAVFFTLQRRAVTQHKAHQQAMDQVQAELQKSNQAIAEETAAKEDYQMQLQAREREMDRVQRELQESLSLSAREQTANQEYCRRVQELEGCVTAEKANTDVAEATLKKHGELAKAVQKRLKERHSSSQLALQKQVDTLEASLVEARKGHKAAEGHAALAALAAAESRASLLAAELDGLKKEAAHKLADTVGPLQKRLTRLEDSVAARAASVEALKHDLTVSQTETEAAREAEQAAIASAAKAQEDATARMVELQRQYGQEVAALRAQLKKPLQGQGSAAQASSSGTAGAALCDPSTEDIAAAEQDAQVLDDPLSCQFCLEGSHGFEACPLVRAAQGQAGEDSVEAQEQADWQVVPVLPGPRRRTLRATKQSGRAPSRAPSRSRRRAVQMLC